MSRSRSVLEGASARWTYWWRNATTPAARTLRHAYDRLPGTRVGWDSVAGAGPSISYGGVGDGLAHVLAPMELWRRESGAADSHRHGGRHLRTLPWSRERHRGDLLVLGLYDREVARHDFGPHLIAPLRIHYLIHLDATAQQHMERFGKKDRENLRRGSRKHDWTLEEARRPADFDLFFDSMHVPTMSERHHGWVRSESRPVADHALFRRGLLFFLRRDGQRVAGVLCRVEGDTLVIRLAGVLDGDDRHYRDGAQMMLYHLVLLWAIDHQIAHAELSGSRPFISEGLFAFKRKFRPQIVVPQNHFAHKRLILIPRRDTPDVRDFLWRHPVIAMRPDQPLDHRTDPGLTAVFFHDGDRPGRLDLPWRCRGISGAEQIDLDEFLAGLPGPTAT